MCKTLLPHVVNCFFLEVGIVVEQAEPNEGTFRLGSDLRLKAGIKFKFLALV